MASVTAVNVILVSLTIRANPLLGGNWEYIANDVLSLGDPRC